MFTVAQVDLAQVMLAHEPNQELNRTHIKWAGPLGSLVRHRSPFTKNNVGERQVLAADILTDFVGKYDIGTWRSYGRIFVRFGVASVLSFRLAAPMCATFRDVSRRGRTLGGSARFAGSLKS